MTDNFWVILDPFCAEVSSGTIIDIIISNPTSCRYKIEMCIRLCKKNFKCHYDGHDAVINRGKILTDFCEN